MSPVVPFDVPSTVICGFAPSKWMNDGSAGAVTFDCVTAAEAVAGTTRSPSTAKAARAARRRRGDMTTFPQTRRAFWNVAVGLVAGRRYPMRPAVARVAATSARRPDAGSDVGPNSCTTTGRLPSGSGPKIRAVHVGAAHESAPAAKRAPPKAPTVDGLCRPSTGVTYRLPVT